MKKDQVSVEFHRGGGDIVIGLSTACDCLRLELRHGFKTPPGFDDELRGDLVCMLSMLVRRFREAGLGDTEDWSSIGIQAGQLDYVEASK